MHFLHSIRKICGLISLVVIFAISCTPTEEPGPFNIGIELTGSEYLIFGHFYGQCSGEQCVETFKLTAVTLFEDVDDNLQSSDFQELPANKYFIAKDLVESFPRDLLDETQTNIGCPDCTDGGGLYIEVFDDGELNIWLIDQIMFNVPGYLHEFIFEVNDTISRINS